MFTQLFISLTLVLDIVFCAVYAPIRSPSSIGFVATNMFAKVGLLFFGHLIFKEMGCDYSLATPTTEGVPTKLGSSTDTEVRFGSPAGTGTAVSFGAAAASPQPAAPMPTYAPSDRDTADAGYYNKQGGAHGVG